MTNMAPIHVLAAPQFDPGTGRRAFEVPQGLTVAEIVAKALPMARDADLARTRVALVTDNGTQIVPRELWALARPRPGVRVVIRVVPGEGALRSVLSIVVSIAAVALTGLLFPELAVGSWQWGLAVAGFSIVGQLLVNALIPPAKPDEQRDSYAITGWKNRYDPGAAVPVVLGTMRFAPPFAATPYTEIVGDDQYIRALFCLGEGELSIDDMRLGETSLAEYDEVETELRYGIAGELPVSLYPRQVVEEQIGVELTRPLPRDDDGEVTQVEEEYLQPSLYGGDPIPMTRWVNAPGIETPVVRTTGPDAAGASVILSFSAGLVRFNDDGRRRAHSVAVRIEHRLAEAEEWQEVTVLDITAAKAEAFWRQHSWSFATRGRWQVRLTMLTDETESSQISQRTSWAALQTIRPEYPLDYPRPLALVALRIKATHQLNGSLDDFNCLVSRICSDWDAETESWVARATQNPAALYRAVLQHASNPKAVADAGIDLDQLADWAAWCAAEGLTYNAVLEEAGTTLRDVLTEIAGAGRATPRHDGLSWGVVIDRPLVNTLVVDHINPRNSWSFSWSRNYIDPPHAFVVKFKDAGNDYKETERQVRWPGYEGEITLTEQLSLPGKVYADEVWREARRRQLETMHRPDSYEVTQPGALRAVTRGDLVALSHDVISRVQVAARVTRVEGALVEIDERVEMVAGESYAIRFRAYDAPDTIGTSVVRTVRTDARATSILTLPGTGEMPSVGALVHFGPAAVESYSQIVTRVEATEDMCAILRTVDAAPQIDTILAATEIPTWSSRVGAEIDENLLQPSAPRFARLVSGLEGTDVANRITYALEPGSGAVATAAYQLEHRLSGAASWTVLTIPAANGGGDLDSYAVGELVEVRAAGISATGVTGPYSAKVGITVGADDAGLPAALDSAAISITTLLGGALIQFATGDDAATTAVQIYRSTISTLDRETDAVGTPITVAQRQTYSTTLGDTTRENLIIGGTMDSASSAGAWTADAGWTIADGVAAHTAGTADVLAQPLAAQAGKYYRLSLSVTGRTAGSLQPYLTGGSDRPGTVIDANGPATDRIQAVTGNDTLELRASADFDGLVDDVTAYLETAACLSAGTHYVWIEPQNSNGAPGPVSGPYTLEIL
ncbi:phage tail protein [Rhodobacter sp. TJ_12]|uniref:TipJ family phage tail tip protein n=1 Tax=Rhodobacter sp. TJ_12 TaxID=2029399 RepID=UPI001CBD0CA7|nr:phage tail protein [Rhodobacter sp. TJ_12]MBZ4022204.1 phage tail protein [Rhodobacter sp. TJ_12]